MRMVEFTILQMPLLFCDGRFGHFLKQFSVLGIYPKLMPNYDQKVSFFWSEYAVTLVKSAQCS